MVRSHSGISWKRLVSEGRISSVSGMARRHEAGLPFVKPKQIEEKIDAFSLDRERRSARSAEA